MRALPCAAVLVVAAALVPPCLAHPVGTAAQNEPDRTTVGVLLKEARIGLALVPSVRTTRAGRVTFVVRNIPVGRREAHEFLVLRTNLPPARLPLDPRTARAKEVGFVARVPAFAAGRTRRITLRMARGRYVLLCNLPVHYSSGQYAGFVVR